MYKLNSDITFREIESSIIVITPWNNSIHTIDNVARDIFLMLKDGLGVEDIVSAIKSSYNSDYETIKKDTTEFIENLLKNKIFIQEAL